MDVSFVLSSPSLERYEFVRGETNPGIGGTQFTTIQLVLRLAAARPDWTINLVNTGPMQVRAMPSNLGLVNVDSVDEYLCSDHARSQDALVVPVRTLRRASLTSMRNVASRVVAWSRHPSDSPLRDIDAVVRLAAVVSVGNYQFHTNQGLRAPHVYIQNLFCPPSGEAESGALPRDGMVRFVHLGALVRGKGFHLIAQQWRAIRQDYPHASLDVIGSADVYRDMSTHPVIPTDREFAEEILQYIPAADLDELRVVFHGSLGAQKFDVIRRCHIALLNPTGRSEAFPASPLECMWVGRPVIGGVKNGMWDSMRTFPELSLQHPDQMPDRIRWLLANPDRYGELVRRARTVAESFAAETPGILERWQLLLAAVETGTTRSGIVTRPHPRPPDVRQIARSARRRARRSRMVHGWIGDLVRWVRGHTHG